MPFGPATILGGLPVIAEVWFSGPDYQGEYDAGVDGIYWQRRDGTAGAPLSEKIMARLSDYWQSDVIDSVSNYLAMRDYEEPEKVEFD